MRLNSTDTWFPTPWGEGWLSRFFPALLRGSRSQIEPDRLSARIVRTKSLRMMLANRPQVIKRPVWNKSSSYFFQAASRSLPVSLALGWLKRPFSLILVAHIRTKPRELMHVMADGELTEQAGLPRSCGND